MSLEPNDSNSYFTRAYWVLVLRHTRQTLCSIVLGQNWRFQWSESSVISHEQFEDRPCVHLLCLDYFFLASSYWKQAQHVSICNVTCKIYYCNIFANSTGSLYCTRTSSEVFWISDALWRSIRSTSGRIFVLGFFSIRELHMMDKDNCLLWHCHDRDSSLTVVNYTLFPSYSWRVFNIQSSYVNNYWNRICIFPSLFLLVYGQLLITQQRTNHEDWEK